MQRVRNTVVTGGISPTTLAHLQLFTDSSFPRLHFPRLRPRAARLRRIPRRRPRRPVPDDVATPVGADRHATIRQRCLAGGGPLALASEQVCSRGLAVGIRWKRFDKCSAELPGTNLGLCGPKEHKVVSGFERVRNKHSSQRQRQLR